MNRFAIALAGWVTAYGLSTLLFPALPALSGPLGPVLAFFALVSVTVPALDPFINLRTLWYYLVILVPTFIELAVLAGLSPASPATLGLLDLSILAYAYCSAKLFAKGIGRDSLLLVILFLLSAADFIAVFAGPARAIARSPFAKYVILHWPVPGSARVELLLGFGDIFAFVLLLSYCYRNDLPVGRNARALYVTLLACGILSAAGGLLLPALPFLCAAFWYANRERFRAARLTPADLRLLGLGLAAVLLVFYGWKG